MMMFLSKEEKIMVLLYRIQVERNKTLLGDYDNYSIGENKIQQLRDEIIKLGGNPDAKIIVTE